jgi:hypothetical protein
MINRKAILIRARPPYLDWINATAPGESPAIAFEQVGQILYRVPKFDDADGLTRVLRQVFHDILLPGAGGMVAGPKPLAS